MAEAGTATLIRVVRDTPPPTLGGFQLMSLYKVDPPMAEGWPDDDEKPRTWEFVIVSAVQNQYAHETYIFGGDEDGEVVDWCELDGSYRGGTSHAEALRGAGYEITEAEADDASYPE